MMKKLLGIVILLFLPVFGFTIFESNFVTLDTQSETKYQNVIDAVYTPRYQTNTLDRTFRDSYFLDQLTTIRNTIVEYLNANTLSDGTFFALEYLIYRIDTDREIQKNNLAAYQASQAQTTTVVSIPAPTQDTVATNTQTQAQDIATNASSNTNSSNTNPDIFVTRYYKGDKNILGGVTTDAVLEFGLIARLEEMEIRDMELIADSQNFYLGVDRVHMYDEDGKYIATTNVYNNTARFDNIQYVLSEGQTDIYFTFDTHPIGRNFIGLQSQTLNFELKINEAVGLTSGRDQQVSLESSDDSIMIVPLWIDQVDIVREYGSRLVDNTLYEFESSMGIIVISVAKNPRNTNTNGGDLYAKIQSITVDVIDDTIDGNIANTLSISELNSNDTVSGVPNANGTVSFDISTLGSDANIPAGSEKAYMITGSPVLDDINQNEMVRIDLIDTNLGGVVYTTNDPDASSIDVLNLRYIDHEGVLIRE